MASNSGQSSAETGSGSRSSRSVCGGWISGRMSPWKFIGSSASAPSHVSDTALQGDSNNASLLCKIWKQLLVCCLVLVKTQMDALSDTRRNQQPGPQWGPVSRPS